MDEKKAYTGIVKGTAIFGGVQVFNILINVLRGKFIALLLGPAGMGISSLLTSTVNTIISLSNLGLNVGAVRDISIANEQSDIPKLSAIALTFRRLVVITGILGALICMLGGRWWSKIAFGNTDYTFAFVILGAMVFFTAVGSGETAILQGTRRLKDLAKTSLIGVAVGLIVGVPMYYFWREQGIAPAMVAMALATFLSNRYFTRKIQLQKVTQTYFETKTYAREMVLLGLAVTAAGFLGSLSTYLISWFVRYNGSIADVGLFQSAASITTQYVGFIFSAMAIDYYPRLAAISHNNQDISRMANQQAEIVLLIATPIIIALLATTPIIIRVLLSKEFMSTIPLLRWLGFSLIFKATSFSLGYISFAKGDKKTFFLLEGVGANILNVTCCILGYYLGGLIGLGVAAVSNYILYLIIVSMVVRRKYEFHFDKKLLKLFALLLAYCILAFSLSFAIKNYVLYGVVGMLLFIVVGWICYKELDKRIDLGSLLKSYLHKNKL